MLENEEAKSKEQQNIDKELKNSEASELTTAKSHGEILKQQIVEGQETYDKNPVSILLSSLTAGLEIGFSYLLICTLYYFLQDKVEEDTIIKLMSFLYPVGFIMVILGQSILFTEQTSLLTLPVLNKKRSLKSLLKLWGLVIFGNLIGGYIIAFFLVWIGPRLQIFDLSTIEKIAVHVTDYDKMIIFASAVLAGWLMGLLSWLIAASKSTLSRIVIIFMITAVLAFTGLHHSIVGNVEVFAGLISSPAITISGYLIFIGLALFGNAFGGAVFVALLKYRAFVYDVKG
ncbi:formate/nitrite transporter family protein [Aequorivita sublithincola DSM 14238]|uniref:Formate/nitrite transporter family protein n=1 Tax=Aequorivita sublithincola (strain DSM 14238 / LMG 21431 / ACAM 643 / 9-3) TaxID=746697 RepID=I3YYT4_AEQSU|nr:formate/nitrite transporter family protein [Aequorivita sublithincola]AFL82152.1 formate/nitrite transporter family protein [Aequorivita sublithincola DSM 14238]